MFILRAIVLVLLLIRYRCLFVIGFLPVFPFNLFRMLYKPHSKKQANNFVAFLEKSGPLFIKLGQVLSTRIDIFSESYIQSLKNLRDQAKSNNKNILPEIFFKSFGTNINEIFQEISLNPIASGSIACVYKGILKNKAPVIIKIIKPNTEKRFKQDLLILKILFIITENLSKQAKISKPTQLTSNLEAIMRLELDLRFEAASADTLKENFADDNDLYIPKIYWEYTAKDILVEEWIDGISVGNVEELKKNNFSMVDIVRKITKIFFYQALRDGFFHGDIHTGNIFVLKTGQIALVDFGIMGKLDGNLRKYVGEVFMAFLSKDYKKAAKIHFDAGWVNPKYNIEDFTLACRSIVEQTMLINKENVMLGKLLEQLFLITTKFEMEIQEELLILQKNLLYLENISRSLIPDQNMWLLSKDVIQSHMESQHTKMTYIVNEAKKHTAPIINIYNLFHSYKTLLEINNNLKNKSYKLNLLLTILCIIIIVYIIIIK